MTVRHIVLAAAAILVVGLGVKLFYDVRASPTLELPPAGAAGAAGAAGVATPSRPAPTRPTDHARDRPVAIAKDRGAMHTEPAAPAKPRVIDLEGSMAEANKAYDHQDYDEAKELANRVLADDPGNVRMRRILVSTACMQGDAPEAQKQFDLLPTSGDARHVMRVRCKREGIVFTESATGPAFQPPRTP